MVDQELRHWGIRGMKWGVRRYQNKDGSLTPAGKKRYDKEMAKAKEEAKVLKSRQRTQAKIDKLNALKKSNEDLKNELDGKTAKPQKAKKSSGKSVKEMSNEELKAVIDRLDLEKRYKDLNPEQTSKGKSFVNRIIDKVIAPSAEEIGKQLVKSAITKVSNSVIKDESLKVFTNNQKKK